MNFFDLHCDTATEAMKIRAGLRGSGLQLDLDRWQGGSLCQSYAVFIPDTLRGEPAWQYFVRCSTYWKEKITEAGRMILLDHPAEAESCWKKGGNACFLAVEGGAVLAGRLEYVQALAGHGVRMLTLTTSPEQSPARVKTDSSSERSVPCTDLTSRP